MVPSRRPIERQHIVARDAIAKFAPPRERVGRFGGGSEGDPGGHGRIELRPAIGNGVIRFLRTPGVCQAAAEAIRDPAAAEADKLDKYR